MNPRFLPALWLLASPLVIAQQSPSANPSSAGQDDPAARFERARALLHGDGVKKDARAAFDLMKSAADQGQADALGGVGYFYSVGLVVRKDDGEAVAWFRRGAEKGSAKSMLNLAKMWLAGRGTGSDNQDKLAEDGLQWMIKAADTGLPEARLAYGSVLFFGDHGVTKDDTKAAAYLKPAAVAGLPDAQNMIGIMTEMGQGVPMDADAAKDWFRKAAMQGNAKAQSNLGRLLGPLNDNSETRTEALAWLILASGQAEVTATKLIEESLAGLKQGEFEAAKRRAQELGKSIGNSNR